VRPELSGRAFPSSVFITERNSGEFTLANEQNLRPPWKKGESGNPKGRPKKKSVEDYVEALLDEVPKGGKGDTTRRELLAQVIVEKMFSRKGEPILREYLKRAWPEINRHEISADVDLNAEMNVAADEIERILRETDS